MNTVGIDFLSIKTKTRAVNTAPDPVGLYFGLRVDIVFGMPKYGCRFHGICKLDVDENDLLCPIVAECGSGKAWLFIPHPAFCLICFDKQSLTSQTRCVQFGRKYFELKETVHFSKTLTNQIGRPLSLQQGQYRIHDKPEVYSVLFRLNNTPT